MSLVNKVMFYMNNPKVEVSNVEKQNSQRYIQQAESLKDNQRTELMMLSLWSNPRNSLPLLYVGCIYLNSPAINLKNVGFKFIETAFNEDYTDYTINTNNPYFQYLATLVGRHNVNHHNYKVAEKFFKIAVSYPLRNGHVPLLQIATCINSYPKTCNDACSFMKEKKRLLKKLLSLPELDLSLTVNESDPYIFCILSFFNLEIYYHEDFREFMNLHYKLSIKAFTDLNYISDKVWQKKDNSQKHKIGIVSGFFYKNNSVIADFGGVLQRLPRSKYDICFIYVKEKSVGDSEFLLHCTDDVLIIDTKYDNWLVDAREKIESLQLDMLFYLESTMAISSHRLMMSKLAPIQIVSHGHPVTTGIEGNIMDYFISWEAAELDYCLSQEHYTEKLLLLPKETMHQYYEPRTLKNGISTIDGKSFKNFTRENFSKYIPQHGTWYACMQKPFKRHPEFDEMLVQIMKRDPNAIIILHDCDIEDNSEIMKNRLQKLKTNMKRVCFLPCLPHHKLMALYNLSDVILDSYYAGGCTTTREALEIGGLVVTLPGKYLGSRWSKAYYSIMGVNDMIATSKQDYIDIAVRLGKDKELRKSLHKKVIENVDKLFYSQDAVASWCNIFETALATR